MRLKDLLSLTRLDRPIGIYLLLWPTLWALWLANDGHPAPGTLLIFVAGVVLMRSAGCVINDIADRHIDPHVQRTRERSIAAGRVTVKEAGGVFAALITAAFLLVLQTNWLTIALAPGALALAMVYPLMKRYTHWPQVVLGMAFAWSIPMVFAASVDHVPELAWWLFVLASAWTLAGTR